MILILGKNGQVGRALVTQLGSKAIAFGQEEVDLTNADFISKMESRLKDVKLTAVINAAAYTAVDKAETDKVTAFRVNAGAVAELAAWCKKNNLPLVHYSTDYVFGGEGKQPHREDDKIAPINVYGKSKADGEEAIAKTGGKYLIFRTSWVYDAYGKNFFNTILRLLEERDDLNVIDDQIGAPTYAPHLAKATLLGLKKAMELPEFPSGIYHLCNSSETSWHGFADAIFALATRRDSGLKCRAVNPIPATSYPLPAKRPYNSRLDCSKALRMLGVSLPDWQAGVKESFDEKYANSGLRDKGLKNHPA